MSPRQRLTPRCSAKPARHPAHPDVDPHAVFKRQLALMLMTLMNSWSHLTAHPPRCTPWGGPKISYDFGTFNPHPLILKSMLQTAATATFACGTRCHPSATSDTRFQSEGKNHTDIDDFVDVQKLHLVCSQTHGFEHLCRTIGFYSVYGLPLMTTYDHPIKCML